MDINKILSDLELDFSNPEAKRGALEAINAILDSRAPIGGGFGGSMGGGSEIDVEVDPDLLQPSVKNQPNGDSDMDIEINDEEGILNQVKRNDSEDDNTSSEESSDGQNSGTSDSQNSGENSSSNNSDTTEKNSIDTDDNNTSTSDSADDGVDVNAEEDSNDSLANAEDIDEFEDSDADNDEFSDNTKNDAIDELEDSEDSDGFVDIDSDEDVDIEDSRDSEEETSGDPDGEESDYDNDEDDLDPEDYSEEDDDEEFDEDDLLDAAYDDLKDIELQTKHEARRIKRERTLAAAKKALADAQARKVSPALIRELERAIEDLESLTEAVKSLKDISDEEFNLKINRVFDAIDAVGDKSLTFSSEEERQLKAKEIKADLASAQTQNELSAEDAAKIRAENQAIKAREKESDKFKTRARGSFKGFQDFLNSLYRAVALQVATEESRDDTWSAISRRNSGANVLRQGKKINDLPNKRIPVIDFYFDQSGSWGDRDIKVGEKAVQCLADMEEKGDIKINIYYFSNHVHTDASSARNEGGTAGWNEIVKNIISTQATNVIIMTDSDMENWWEPQDQSPLTYTVPGYVWYLWRNGSNAPRLPRDLKGRGGTQQFSFGTSDA